MNDEQNLTTLTNGVARKLGITKKDAKEYSKAVLDVLFDMMVENESVTLKGYFSSEHYTIKGRDYNIITVGKIRSKDKPSIKIKPSVRMLEAVKGN